MQLKIVNKIILSSLFFVGLAGAGEFNQNASGAVFKFSFDKNLLYLPQSKKVFGDAADVNSVYDEVNSLRSKVGLIPLSYNSKLQEAASKHIDYMLANKVYGHYEEEGKDGFVGVTPMDRGREMGYDPTYYAENLTVGYSDPKGSIDALMQSIYHRFVFLDFYINEIGIGYKNLIYNYDMGNQGDIEQTASQNPAFVVWPSNGNTNAQVVFANFEEPNPLSAEGCQTGGVTGNPISIQFNPRLEDVSMESFKLFDGNKEVETQVVLSKQNDPNELFGEREFALYPTHPLEINTKYKAVFKGYVDGEYKVIQWSFITRNYNYPRYRVVNGGSYNVVEGKTYLLHVIPDDCSESISKYTYTGDADVTYLDLNLIKITPRSDMHFSMGNVEFDLILSESDNAISPSAPTKNGSDLDTDSQKVDILAYDTKWGIEYLLKKASYTTKLDFLEDQDPKAKIYKDEGVAEFDLGESFIKSDENGNLHFYFEGEALLKSAIPLGTNVKVTRDLIEIEIQNMPNRLDF